MSDNWFFLSYARLDRETDKHNCISRFYEDLNERVRAKKKIKEGNAGFFDGVGIQQGDVWPESLAKNLGSCRVLVCLYSPAYFDSLYCGKEWQVFATRVKNAFPAEAERPRLILPILFSPPQDIEPLPQVAADIQYMDDDYPEAYRENGLRYMMVRTNQENNYQDFLDSCIEKLAKAADAYPLGALQVLPDIKTVLSAFHLPCAAPENARTPLQNVGPRYAEFIYVAARRDEVETIEQDGLKPRVDYYGEEGELDWKPYLSPDESPDDKEIWKFGTWVAYKEDFRYEHLRLEKDLVQRVEEAQNNNRIVILIVDTWTLRLQKYRELMQDYDKVVFWNSVALITWNKSSSSQDNREQLKMAVEEAFPRKSLLSDERYFIDSIYSPTDLEGSLSVALQRTKMQILEVIKRYRRIEGDKFKTSPEIIRSERTVP